MSNNQNNLKKIFNDLNSDFIQQIIQRGIQISGGISYKFCYINLNTIIDSNFNDLIFLKESIIEISNYFKKYNVIVAFIFIYFNNIQNNYYKNRIQSFLINECEDIIIFKDIESNLTYQEDIENDYDTFLYFLNLFDCYILINNKEVEHILKTEDWKNKYIILTNNIDLSSYSKDIIDIITKK